MKPKTIWQNKGAPEGYHGEWRTIEFELVFNSKEIMNSFVNWVKDTEYTPYITIKEDHSIHPKSNDYDGIPKEVIVSFRKDYEGIVRDVCRFLRKKAYVNKSCGTHVHFDMRGIDREQVKKYGKRLAAAVPALKKMLPQSRQNNRFCLEAINDPSKAVFDHGDHKSRYAFVNMEAYNKHGTIEVRGHDGTLNARKILNWIAICEKIMSRNPPSKKGKDVSVKNVEELINHFKFNKTIVEYINDRTQKLEVLLNKKTNNEEGLST